MQREVGVLVWYPAAIGRGALAPYLTWGTTEVRGFAGLLGGDRNAFDGLATVRTHAFVDAEPSVTPKQFPLLVFSHGYGGLPSAHTALLEDLASHGFVVLSETALFTYLCTATYDRDADAGVRSNDARLAIDWPVAEPILSAKDANAPFLDDLAPERLPTFA